MHTVNRISLDCLRETLKYDPNTGVFTWKVKPSKNIPVGAVAGTRNYYGYIVITIDKVMYQAGRLAWYITHGFWPEQDIDHIDRCRSNNALDNLRPATRSQNLANKGKHKGAVPYKGVSIFRNKYRAYVYVRGKQIHLGLFNTAEEAHDAYIKAAKYYYGEFARGE